MNEASVSRLQGVLLSGREPVSTASVVDGVVALMPFPTPPCSLTLGLRPGLSKREVPRKEHRTQELGVLSILADQ